jgi:hypothetical protein
MQVPSPLIIFSETENLAMEFFYRALCHDLKLAEDAALIADMKQKNEEKLKNLERTLKVFC